MLLKKHPASSIAALSALLFAQSVWAADTLTDALTGGKASANLQYRYEDVRNASVPAAGKNTNVATANTVRLRLGYETATFNGFGAMVEAESSTDLGNKKYNSTNPATTQYAIIQEPEISEINQAYLSYSGLGNTTVKWGRQRIKLDNDRFIGNVGWRLNEQTFDSFTLVNKSLPSTTITAGYITNVNRVIGDGVTGGNAPMRSPIFNVSYKGWSFAEIVAYAYLLDYNITAPYNANAANSADSYGLRLNGSTPIGGNKLLYTVEFAEQRDGSNNTTNFKDTYTFLEGGVDWTNVAVFKVGYEVLGTDLSATTKATGKPAATPRAFYTPLATLHAFNGWADMFAAATPVQGLKDAYLSARTNLAGVTLGADYHDYRADKTTTTLSSNQLGNEWDLIATYAFNKNTSIGAKYADYKAKGTTGTTFATNFNTKKTWFWGEFKF